MLAEMDVCSGTLPPFGVVLEAAAPRQAREIARYGGISTLEEEAGKAMELKNT